MRLMSLFACLTLLSLLIAACGTGATPEPTAAPTVAQVPSPQPSTSEGQRLFIANGCAACHGQDGEGSQIAPALAGHSAAQVRRQVRAPIGIMPVFPQDKISKEELDQIVEYIEHLEAGGHTHQMASTTDALAMHHWMALLAIESGDIQEGIHHVGHIIELTQGDHQARMREAMSLLEQGDTHGAAHIIEEMVAGLGPAQIEEDRMHLTMALPSLRVEEQANAIHHMDHYLEMADEHQREDALGIMALLHDGKMHDAEHELEELMGDTRGMMESEHTEDAHMEPHDGHP